MDLKEITQLESEIIEAEGKIEKIQEDRKITERQIHNIEILLRQEEDERKIMVILLKEKIDGIKMIESEISDKKNLREKSDTEEKNLRLTIADKKIKLNIAKNDLKREEERKKKDIEMMIKQQTEIIQRNLGQQLVA